MKFFWLNVDDIDGVIHKEGFVSNQDDTKGILKNIRNATEKNYGVNPNPRSIPHPWARAILTERYVLMEDNEVEEIETEEGKNLYKSMVGRWRGCISLIALSEIYGLSLDYKEINNLNKIGTSIEFMKPTPDKAFVISPFAIEHPEKVTEYSIYCNHEPIAMTSQTVGIIPGFLLGDNSANQYPWAVAGEFVDPIEKLSRGERIILYAWLSSFIESLEEQKNTAQDRSSKLVKALTSFQTDLGLSEGDIKIGNEAGQHTNFIKGIDKKDNIYIGLDRRIELNTSNYSEAIIKDTNICVVDENQHKIDYGKEILLLGMLDSRMFLQNKNLFEKFLPEGKEVFILSSNDIFLENCFGFGYKVPSERESNDVKGIDVNFSTMGIDSGIHKVSEGFKLREGQRHKPDSYVCILPVKASAAQKLKDNIISDSVNVAGIDGKIAVKIGFALQQGGQVSIERQYILGDTLHELPSVNIPTTAIWPNIPNCHYYYMASKWGIDIDDGFIFAPVDEEIVQKSGERKYENVYTYTTDEYPKMLRCYRHNPENSMLEEIGIIKTRSLAPLGVQTKVGEYSLDFGTSSTVAAYRLSSDTPDTATEITFENQVSVITTSAKAAKDINKLMFGVYKVPSPFPTIYFDKSKSKVGILKGGHPYFGIPGKKIAWDSDQLVSNIKFTAKGDETIVNIQKDFIKSIICMMMVHAARNGIINIELKISYPISIKNIGAFKDGIQQEISLLQSQNLFPVTLINTGEFITESEAAARFFSSKKMGLKNSLTIDIGGGSVDIFAFTQLVSGHSAMISSITKGSRVILLDTLKKGRDLVAHSVSKVLEKYKTTEEIIEKKYTKPQTYSELSSGEYYTAMEILLLHNFNVDGIQMNLGDEISNVFRRADGILGSSDNIKRVRGLQTIWLFWLSSFFYYGALMYNKSWSLVAGEHDALYSLQIFLSGRGSNLIDWLPINVDEFLVAVAKSALNRHGAVINLERNEKKERKLESAKGMLLPALKAGATSEALDKNSFILNYIAGEKFFDKEEKEQDEYTFIKSQTGKPDGALDAKQALLRIDNDYPVFKKFLEIYSDCVQQFGLQDTVYKLYLGDISELHDIDQSEYISLSIGEFNSLVSTYVVQATAGATDEPIFSALADAAGKLLNEKLL